MSQQTPAPRHDEAVDGREALLAATVRVVARHGFDGLTYRAVGKEAGTTHGLVSYHFGSREALIDEAAVWASTRAAESVDLTPAGGAPDDFVRGLADSIERDIDSHMFQYELTLQARRRPGLGDEMRAVYRRYCELTLQALRSMGVDATPALGRLVFATLDGIVLQQIMSEDPTQTQETIDELHRILTILIDHPTS
jgi:AcrR family transcriptional regulator